MIAAQRKQHRTINVQSITMRPQMTVFLSRRGQSRRAVGETRQIQKTKPAMITQLVTENSKIHRMPI
jgi:hypothetical protein